MDKAISVGDLVMIVRPTKCGHGRLGAIFTVAEIRKPRGRYHCEKCKISLGNDCLVATGYGRFCIELDRLKRIPPLSEPETTERKQEQPA